MKEIERKVLRVVAHICEKSIGDCDKVCVSLFHQPQRPYRKNVEHQPNVFPTVESDKNL